MTRQIILDTETTGLSPQQGHRLIEIGCLEMINRRLTKNRFHFYINPLREIDEGAVKVHGITTEFLKDKPTFDKIAADLFSFLEGAELIIHNAPFDIGFLNAEFERINKKWIPITGFCGVIDTLPMARRAHPGQQNTLDALCRRYGVNNTHRDLHGALIDAALLAEVYLLMTGGQTQLFSIDVDDEKNDVVVMSDQKLQRSQKVLPIVMASADELMSHELFLDKLAKKGKCVWRSF